MKKLIMLAVTGLLAAFSHAQSVPAQAVGDWFYGADNDGLPYIFTMNDSGGVFGRWCDKDSESCVWLLLVKTQCDLNAVVPALINADSGATGIELTCLGERTLVGERYYRLSFNNYSVVNSIVSRNSRIGVAVGSKDDGFRVFRFPISGGTSLLPRMDAAASARLEMLRRRGTKDRVL